MIIVTIIVRGLLEREREAKREGEKKLADRGGQEEGVIGELEVREGGGLSPSWQGP